MEILREFDRIWLIKKNVHYQIYYILRIDRLPDGRYKPTTRFVTLPDQE